MSVAASLRYRAVIFDLDGTLVDSYAALTEAVNYARRRHGLHELSAARIREFVGDGLDKLLQRAFDREKVPLSVSDAFESRYDEICCAESKVLADVEATLARLAGAGVAMAVCTKKPTSFSKKILDFLQLPPYFPALLRPAPAWPGGSAGPSRRRSRRRSSTFCSSRRTSAPSSGRTWRARASRRRGMCCTRGRRRRARRTKRSSSATCRSTCTPRATAGSTSPWSRRDRHRWKRCARRRRTIIWSGFRTSSRSSFREVP